LISPGTLNDCNFEHKEISDFRIPGLTSISGAFVASSILGEVEASDFDIILVDWRYVYLMRKSLRNIGLPWAIIDRGPPVRKGFFNRFQKWFWSRGWETADKHSVGGFVVSEKHRDFVIGLIGYKGEINVVPAGSIKNDYLAKKGDPRDLLRLAYAGQLDARRGVEKIFELSDVLTLEGIAHKIHVCGNGDSVNIFEKKGNNYESLIIEGKIPHEEVLQILSKCHVGIMPMPDIPVWRISSTLKLAEYLASGLLIIGPDHPGNKTKGMGLCSISQEDWVDGCLPILKEGMGGDWDEIVNSSLELSQNLSWKSIAEKLGRDLEELLHPTLS
jgi:glycosyltransferase involved in cell wall biosynthesis